MFDRGPGEAAERLEEDEAHLVALGMNVNRLMAVCSFAYSLPVHGLRYWAALQG